MENSPQSSLTNSGSTTGESSPGDKVNASLYENLSVKVFLHCWESDPLYQTFSHLEQVWSTETKCFFVCHSYEDIALCIDVKKKKKFVVMSPDFAHPEMYGVLPPRTCTVHAVVILGQFSNTHTEEHTVYVQ